MTAPALERLTKRKAAEYLEITTRTLDRWHAQRIGPPRVKVGAKIWYLRDSLDRWILAQERVPVRAQERR